MKLDEMTLELDNKLLDQMRDILAPYGMEPEELTAAFIQWCVDNPQLAKKTLMKWKAELHTEDTRTENDEGRN